MKKSFLSTPAYAELLFVLLLSFSSLNSAWGAEKAVVNPPPTSKDWADIAKLPDWSGVWNPKVTDQDSQVKTNPPPWNKKAAALVEHQFSEERAGRPFLVFWGCLPEAMPSWMLITHNAFEFLFTPGRVTMLGESDGNRIRRIYTDGRDHPADVDPTFHGHSVGRWEGDTLVVDTVGVHPQAYLAITESAGVPIMAICILLSTFTWLQKMYSTMIWKLLRPIYLPSLGRQRVFFFVKELENTKS